MTHTALPGPLPNMLQQSCAPADEQLCGARLIVRMLVGADRKLSQVLGLSCRLLCSAALGSITTDMIGRTLRLHSRGNESECTTRMPAAHRPRECYSRASAL